MVVGDMSSHVKHKYKNVLQIPFNEIKLFPHHYKIFEEEIYYQN